MRKKGKGLLLISLSGLCLLVAGCVTQDQLDELNTTIKETRAAVEAQPQTPQTGKVLAVLDEAGRVVRKVPVIEDGATAGQAISATAPLAGPYAPWVTLLGGAIGAYYTARRSQKSTDEAFDEGVKRGASGEVAPPPSSSGGTQ
jgi:outer membrane murein-binding lipoprotein Lpp